MNKEDLREEEGLFITEFSDDFFRESLKESRSLEEDVNRIYERMNGKETWRHIFQEILQEILPEGGLAEEFNNNHWVMNDGQYKNLEKIIRKFYSDPLFLYFDVAQKIGYNLSRISESISFSIKDPEKELWNLCNYEDLIEIGRATYRLGYKKTIQGDLYNDLNRLRKKYEKFEKPKVSFATEVTKDRIFLESDYLELNLLYLANEKFEDYLYHTGSKKSYYNTLQSLVDKLDNKGIPMQYVWEKLTNFNAICVISKYLLKILQFNRDRYNMNEARQEADWGNMMDYFKYFFRVIRSMPNYLTRLLLEKQIFSYLGNGIINENCLRQITLLLQELNGKYTIIQTKVYMLACLVKWRGVTAKERPLDRKEWIQELEEEFPMSIFEALYLSSDISSDIREFEGDISIGSKYKGDERYKLLFDNIGCRTKWSNASLKNQNIALWKELENKLLYLSIVNNYLYLSNSKKIAQELCDMGFIVLDETFLKLFDDSQDTDEIQEVLLGEIESGTEIKNREITYDTKDMTRRLENVIKPYLLSDHSYIMFENVVGIEMYKKFINILLYRFYK